MCPTNGTMDNTAKRMEAFSFVETALAQRVGMTDARARGFDVALKRVENFLEEDPTAEQVLDLLLQIAAITSARVTNQEMSRLRNLLSDLETVAKRTDSLSLYLAIKENQGAVEDVYVPGTDLAPELSRPISDLPFAPEVHYLLKRRLRRYSGDPEPTVGDLVALSRDAILSLNNIGEKRLKIIEDTLADLGLKLADSDLT